MTPDEHRMTPDKHRERMQRVNSLTSKFIRSSSKGTYHPFDIPKFETDDGRFLTIEPEYSVVYPHITFLTGAYHALSVIPGLKIVPKSRRDFTYPTASLSALDDPYIMRCKSNYFTGPRMDSLKTPKMASLGIKSRGKQVDRLEYEVAIADSLRYDDPRRLFEMEFGNHLPEDVAQYAATHKTLWGWMAVQRAGFEAIYSNPDVIGDNIVALAGSFDAYNIGARPDLKPLEGRILGSTGAEMEMEAHKVFSRDPNISDKEKWRVINATMDIIHGHMQTISPAFIVPTNQNKTERITHQTATLLTEDEVRAIGLKPSDFISTSQSKKGRPYFDRMCALNELFNRLPGPRQIHRIAIDPPEIAANQIERLTEGFADLRAA